ncbi:unnamed protein product [Sphagnum balticum]
MVHACIGMRRFQEWRRPSVREYSTGNTDGTTAMTCVNGVEDDEEATKRSTEDRGRSRKSEEVEEQGQHTTAKTTTLSSCPLKIPAPTNEIQ